MKTRRLDAFRQRLATEEGLRFPGPFFWTTNFLDRVRDRDPDLRRHLMSGTIETLAAPPDAVRVVAEGDSWFHHPCITDIMDWLQRMGYAPYRSDALGRSLAEMVHEKVYLTFLQDDDVKAVLLSGGGNDLIDWKGSQDRGLHPIFQNAGGSPVPRDWINEAQLAAALANLRELLGAFISDVRGKRPRMPIIVHCYAHIIPRRTGPLGAWLGLQMDTVGIPQDAHQLRNDIAAILIDRANDTYRSVADTERITYVDVRRIVRGRWWDEIHPTSDAFEDIARELARHIPGRRRGRSTRPARGSVGGASST
jgi:hypothetical protein